MLFGYFTLLVALIIESVGAYYSVTGLAAIFSGAVIPILIMGGSLEVGKVTAAVWLKMNWERASIAYKLYLVPAVAFLMLLTSMGIFGYLSKAHSDQGLVSGDSMAKVAIYDEKIKTAKDNIEANRKALKQMDEAVDQVMGRSTDEKGADKAVAIRRGQQKERARLQSEIATEQASISKLSEERAPFAAEFRKIENEVGPIKYIAALIYGDNPDANILERAVRWVIILIVAVFDPLALVLILAAQQSLRWARGEDTEEKEIEKFVEQAAEETLTDIQAQEENTPVVAVPVEEVLPDIVAEANEKLAEVEPETDYEAIVDNAEEALAEEDRVAMLQHELARSNQVNEEAIDALQDLANDYSKLEQEHTHTIQHNLSLEQELGELRAQLDVLTALEPVPEPEVTEIKAEVIQDEEAKVASVAEVVPDTQPEEPKILTLGIDAERPGDYLTEPTVEVVEDKPNRRLAEAAPAHIVYEEHHIASGKMPQMELQPIADNEPVLPPTPKSSFGIEFPATADKGDLFLRTDYLPSKLFKFNGERWIELDKGTTDSYAYDEAYIQHLVEKIARGEYDVDELNDTEREQVEEYLRNQNV